MTTARFSQVVAQCGQPFVHLTWFAPERDRTLMSALKENRVMTIHHVSRGALKDYGTIGLLKSDARGQILVFPKSLRRFAEKRIVGINYSLLAEAGAEHAARDPKVPEIPPRPKPAPKKVERVVPNALTEPARATPPPERTNAVRQGTTRSTSRAPAPERTNALRTTRSTSRAPAVPALTWPGALEEIEAARRELKRRRDIAAYERLGRLAERIRSRDA